MKAPVLRTYQSDCIDRFEAAVADGKRRILLQMPTGSGKTVVIGEIVARAQAQRWHVLFLAHRRELISQASAKLHAVGVGHGVLQAGITSRPGEPIQVASISTLHARAVRGRSIDLPQADLVVVDECHHATAKTYEQIISKYPDAVLLGVTATPCRGDGRGLGSIFDTMIEGPTVEALVRNGFLVPTRVYAPSKPDLSSVNVERGDFVEKQLAEIMDKGQLVGDIVTNWLRLARRRRTVVFATGVAHSVHIRDEYRRAGVLAEHIDGGTPAPEREAILRRLSSGQVDVVSNAMVLTEGWDEPSVSCLVLARPTRQIGLYRQMAGRVLRPFPGKTDALVLDHSGAVFTHGFVEDPVIWTLEPDRRAKNVTHSGRGEHGMPSLTTCPECQAVRFEGRPCEACGWTPRKRGDAVEVVDGDLAAVERDRSIRQELASAEERAAFHRQLAYIAREKGYKSGWAAHKFKEKFGAWPTDRWVNPELPDPAVRSWVRSRQIAYAKGMANRGAA